jgi:hypothetical protein
LVFDNTLKRRVARNATLPERVRVAVRAPLEAQPVEKRLGVRARNDVLHDQANLKFDAQGVQERDDVGVIPDPGAPEASCLVSVGRGCHEQRLVWKVTARQGDSFVE